MTARTFEVIPVPGEFNLSATSAEKLHADTLDAASKKPIANNGERVIDRNKFYISQARDREYKSFLFGCGPTSLAMALADFDIQGFSPPSEAKRVEMMKFTGVMAAGEYPGGPKLMTEHARHYGLEAEDKTGCTDIKILDQHLLLGRGAVVNGPNHFVYIAGKAPDGTYIVGDPSYPEVSHWTAQHLSEFMRGSGNGFTVVWKGDGNAQRTVINDTKGTMPPAVVSRGDSKSAAPIDGGGNGSPLAAGGGGSGGGALSGGNGPGKMAEVPSDAATGTPSPDEQRYYDSLPTKKSPGQKFDVVTGLDMQNFTDKLVYAISKNEGSFETINPNDNGYGISIGIMQWNQKVGQLPDLLQAMLEEDPTEFLSLAGPEFSKDLMDASGQKIDPDKVRKLNFHRYTSRMQKLLASKSLQQAQLKLAREQVLAAEKIGVQFGFKSEAGLAIIVDAVNQAGAGAVSKALQDGNITQIVQTKGEQAGIQALEQALNRPNAQQRDDQILSSGLSFNKTAS